MLARTLMALLTLLGACAGPPRPLVLYPDATEVRLFANPVGFALPEGVSLEQTFDHRVGASLSEDEASIVSHAVTLTPPPEMVTECAHVWRHVFVFYDGAGVPLGALAFCMECGAVTILGPADPNVPLHQLRYDGSGLRDIIEVHDMIVEEQYPE